MALDFSLLGQGPDFGNALTSYRAGQLDRRQTNVRNALTQYKDDPTKAIPDLIANGDMETASALRTQQRQDREDQRGEAQRATRTGVLGGYGTDPTKARQDAMASGDVDLVKMVSEMDDNQRTVAAQNADNLASIGMAVLNNYKTPEERKAWALQPQNTEALQRMGMKPDQIAAFTWDDAAIQTVIDQALTVTEVLAREKAKSDAAFRDRDFEEKVRHNRATEGFAGQNADTRRITATRPRAASGGGVSSTLPPGYAPMGD